jgi:hypothetical protein
MEFCRQKPAQQGCWNDQKNGLQEAHDYMLHKGKHCYEYSLLHNHYKYVERTTAEKH